MTAEDEAQKAHRENWERHEPFRRFNGDLSLIEKITKDADEEAKSWQVGGPATEWAIFYYNMALVKAVGNIENLLRRLALRSSNKSKYYNAKRGRFEYSFQRYDHLQKFINEEFGIDIDKELEPKEIDWFKFILACRHIIIHNGEIVDDDFMKVVNSLLTLPVSGYTIGTWFGANHDHVNAAYVVTKKIKNLVEKEVSKKDKDPIGILMRSP